MRLFPSTSGIAIIAMCLGAFMLPAYAAPSSIHSGVDVQKRTFNLAWMNTTNLEPNPTSYPPDYGTYNEILENNSEENILEAIKMTFSNLIGQGRAPIQASTPASYNGSFAGVVGTLFVLQSEVPNVSNDMSNWFGTAETYTNDTLNNLATWTNNALEIADVIEICLRFFYDDTGTWGNGLFQLGWKGSFYVNTGSQITAKINACSTASYSN